MSAQRSLPTPHQLICACIPTPFKTFMCRYIRNNFSHPAFHLYFLILVATEFSDFSFSLSSWPHCQVLVSFYPYLLHFEFSFLSYGLPHFSLYLAWTGSVANWFFSHQAVCINIKWIFLKDSSSPETYSPLTMD